MEERTRALFAPQTRMCDRRLYDAAAADGKGKCGMEGVHTDIRDSHSHAHICTKIRIWRTPDAVEEGET